jgi:8-oxo-dGTP pyrophosphatase MutT (NUDIX family)
MCVLRTVALTAGQGANLVEIDWMACWPPAPGLEIRQVYGIVFDGRSGRVVVQEDGERYNLPGGTPEPGDTGLLDTLARECFEESQIRLSAAEPIGYQRVAEDDGTTYAQTRFVAVLTEVCPRRPDPSTGRVYGRMLVSPMDAPDLLCWGSRGIAQFAAAVAAAERRWGIEPARSGARREYIP